MTDADRPGIQEPRAVNLFKVLTLKQVLILVKVLTAGAIVLHLVYFVAASLVRHNGVPAAIDRLGTTAYAIATDFVLYGIACIIEFFRKK